MLFSEDASCHYGMVTMATPTMIPLPTVIMCLVKSVSYRPLRSGLNERTHARTLEVVRNPQISLQAVSDRLWLTHDRFGFAWHLLPNHCLNTANYTEVL